MRITGLGSMPGSDMREASRIVLDLTPELVAWPELPMRDEASAMIGRTLGLLDLPTTLDNDGWRLAAATGLQQARAARWWRNDLDDFDELAQDHAAPVKVAITGPWTLAAQVRGSHPTMDHVLADPGACREVGQALAAATSELVARLRQRLGRDIIVQLDEPAIAAVLAGGIAGFSGLHRYRTPDVDEVLGSWRAIVTAALSGGAQQVWLHSCAPGVPFGLASRAGITGVALDSRHVDNDALDSAGELLDAGGTLALGIARTDRVAVPTADELVRTGHELLRRLAIDPAVLDRGVVLTPACGLGTWPAAGATALLQRLGEAAPLLAERLRS